MRTHDENRKFSTEKKLELFEKKAQVFRNLVDDYVDKFDCLQDDIAKTICRVEYARGGSMIHRGFYSPSMMDLFTGGQDRGSLYKRANMHQNCTYAYYFDIQNRLVRVDKYSNTSQTIQSVEFLEYSANEVLSFEYDMWKQPVLHFISRCLYGENEKIYRYETALFCVGDSKDCIEIQIESYEYNSDNLINVVVWERYAPLCQLVNRTKYLLGRDERGYISMYSVVECGDDCSPSVSKTSRVFHVYKKRI